MNDSFSLRVFAELNETTKIGNKYNLCFLFWRVGIVMALTVTSPATSSTRTQPFIILLIFGTI